MKDWISLAMDEPFLSPIVHSFAKAATGGKDDDEGDDEDEDDDEDDEEDEDDDPDEGKTDEELRAELKETRKRLTTANGASKKRRLALRAKEKELEEARAKKPAKKSKDDDEDDGPDVEAIKREAAAPALKRAKFTEAKLALRDAGVSPDRVARVAKMLDLDELDLDDEGLDGIDEAIDKLKADVPEFFTKTRRRRSSVSGDGSDGDGGKPRRKDMSTSERQALALTRGGR